MELTEEQILKLLDEEIDYSRVEIQKICTRGLFHISSTREIYLHGLEVARKKVKQSIAEAQSAPQQPPSQEESASNS